MFCTQEKETFVGVTFAKLTFRKIFISIEEPFMYGLTDFTRKDNTLLGSKLTSYFNQIQ